jgi:DNA-directed RNA polymerase specialized sigma24 family protein
MFVFVAVGIGIGIAFGRHFDIDADSDPDTDSDPGISRYQPYFRDSNHIEQVLDMTDAQALVRFEELFRAARAGSQEAFAEWMGMVEIPLRRALGRFARAVDIEVVVQETFLRMWLAAGDPQRTLEGDGASLKFAHAVARNVALEEIRRCRPDRLVDLEQLMNAPEVILQPVLPDPALGRAIRECMEALPAKPRTALAGRIDGSGQPDKEIAQGLRMRLNTFLQNIVRARRLLARCLERRGVRLGEVLS